MFSSCCSGLTGAGLGAGEYDGACGPAVGFMIAGGSWAGTLAEAAGVRAPVGRAEAEGLTEDAVAGGVVSAVAAPARAATSITINGSSAPPAGKTAASKSSKSAAATNAAPATTANPVAFVEPHQVGRREGVDTKACGFQDRAQIGNRRTLAIGAGDMNHRRHPPFGMTEPCEQALDTVEGEIDFLRMQQ